MEKSTDFLKDMPTGPLDKYRKEATFDWKEMKLVFEDPELLKLKIKVWETFENDPLFQRSETAHPTEEMKRISAKQLHRYLQYQFLPNGVMNMPYKKKTRYMMTVNEALAICFPDVSVKHAIGVALLKNTISTLGTERHKPFLDAIWSRKVIGCVALTEVAHGSNTKKMRTTATFDKATKEFIIHTPDFEAAKCWIGNGGKTSTMAILFAQLITNGQNHGLHAFIVPLRDPRTLLPYQGIIIADMGEKIGLHGIDNGFIIFKNYRIPKDNLLNRFADVDKYGEYESSFSEPGKILGAALENLSTARVGITQEASNTLINAVTIAVRYAVLRKQFSNNGDDEELPIIEYQLHQWRLFPYVAAAAVLKIFINSFTNDYLETVEMSMNSDRLDEVNNLVSEIHSCVSSAKPLLTWTARDAIQECREACGGHGFLKAARFGDLRGAIDATVTYEGDNNVLGQQTANWLVRQWNGIFSNGGVASPLKSCDFLMNHEVILRRRFVEGDVESPRFIQETFEWLVTYLVKETNDVQVRLEQQGESKFFARTKSQVYHGAILTRVYGEFNALRHFWNRIQTVKRNLKIILNQLGSLYGLSCLDRHLVYFYQGGYTSSPQMAKTIKSAILKLCVDLRPNIIGIIDALAPPDYALNSVLGKSDGQLYDNLASAFFQNLGAISRPSWWNEIVFPDAPDITKLPRSKL